MAVHVLPMVKDNLIGSFTAEVPPVLTIDSGDSIHFQTPDAGWGIGKSYGERYKPFERIMTRDGGHAMIGPIYIREAKPGMTLEIKFDHIIPGNYGFTSAGRYPNWQNQKLDLTSCEEINLEWTLDHHSMTGSCRIRDKNYSVGLRPFMGVIGMPPEDTEVHSTWPPRYCGGNLDCKELVSGSTLYLPVSVAGGYLAIGDGHAVQGDGEVSCQAIECPMDGVEITVNLLHDLTLKNPRANTPNGWITLGFHEDLNEATIQALDAMLDLMGELYGLNRVEAIALGSSVLDLRVTQIVNGVKGVHACLPHGAIRI